MTEPESNWRKRYLFLPVSGEHRAAMGIGVLSTDTGQLQALSNDPAYEGFAVEWRNVRKHGSPSIGIPGAADAVEQPFVLRHWEPPRSIFNEGDWIAGPFPPGAVPADCAAAADSHWRDYGLSDGDLIGLLTPLAR